MDLLIAEPLEADVLQWLDARHELFYAPRLARERRAFQEALASTRAVLIPPQIGIDAQTLENAPNLQAIGRIVAGPENIDLSACARQKIEVVRSSDAAAPAEAEFMLGALLALLRPSPEDADRIAGRELGACTVGLVGMTQTSRVLARLLQPLGSRIVGYDPSLHASDGQWSRWGVQPLGLRELFENTDAVCVQMSYYNRYRGLLGERALPYCRQGQVLVSVSPLALFNEEVLADVLKSGRMAAAWLDSMGPGSLDPGQPLHNARGLLATPRLAAYTREARLRSAWGVARRIDEILRTSNAKTPMSRSSSTPRPSAATPEPAPAPMRPIAPMTDDPLLQPPLHGLSSNLAPTAPVPLHSNTASQPIMTPLSPSASKSLSANRGSGSGYRSNNPVSSDKDEGQPTLPFPHNDEQDMLFRQNEMQQIFANDLLFRNTVSPDAAPAPAPVREST
ncbi:MAG: NAD(P)-dependent oxidoreductase [Leptothrix ochracea]|uniref:NAD(P)-dependent oxidoreductase n=1 Tax=Leptothrix ochracea TaxID=735331 RepID=UPI0034E1A477